MIVLVNGEPREVDPKSTVADLIRGLGIDPGAPGLAVALNAEVVSRRRWSETLLVEGNRVEVIRATQGG